MENSELVEKVTEIVQSTVDTDEELSQDEPLIESGIIDSFIVLQLFTSLQSELNVELGIEDITEDSFRSIQSIAEMIASKQA